MHYAILKLVGHINLGLNCCLNSSTHANHRQLSMPDPINKLCVFVEVQRSGRDGPLQLLIHMHMSYQLFVYLLRILMTGMMLG